MVVLVHRYNADRLFAALGGCDDLIAGRASWGKHPVVISYAINLVVDIDGEGNTVETLVADTTPEATRMIRLAHGL